MRLLLEVTRIRSLGIFRSILMEVAMANFFWVQQKETKWRTRCSIQSSKLLHLLPENDILAVWWRVGINRMVPEMTLPVFSDADKRVFAVSEQLVLQQDNKEAYCQTEHLGATILVASNWLVTVARNHLLSQSWI